MKIALMGFGKMGHEVETVAREQGDPIVSLFDSKRPATPDSLAEADVCIDFSVPGAVLSNIRAAAEARKDIVVGTTGWYEHLPEVYKMTRDSGLVYSANFSIGMNLFFRVVARAAEMIDNFPQYDPYIHEIHHRQKADSPSGTALYLAEILLDKIERKTKVLRQPLSGKITEELLHVSSTRAGAVTGTHTVGFDSDADSIELRHVSKNRRGFALGALTAARWIRGRKGVYTMDDVEL